MRLGAKRPSATAGGIAYLWDAIEEDQQGVNLLLEGTASGERDEARHLLQDQHHHWLSLEPEGNYPTKAAIGRPAI